MLKVIFNRRTIREYKPDAVSPVMINQILKAGLYAPFASREIPIRYILCEDKKVLSDLRKIHPYGKALETAPAAIVVCCDLSKESIEDIHHSDCAAASENIMLAASSLGLGSCWIGLFPWDIITDSVSEYFKLPENIRPYSIITLGYPNEEPPVKNIEINDEFVHYNQW